MLCQLMEAGKAGRLAVLVCGDMIVSLSTGGVLSVLAQLWHTDLWSVHSGDTGGGEVRRILSEVFWSIECHGKSLSSSYSQTMSTFLEW